MTTQIATLSKNRAERDTLYSMRVDEGVYVYSVDGCYLAEKYKPHWCPKVFLRIVGGLLVVLDIVLVFLLKTGKQGDAFAIIAIGSVIGLLVQVGCRPICYRFVSLFIHRDSRAVAKQIELIEQYHKNGVINDQTYQRLRDATEQKKVAAD